MPAMIEGFVHQEGPICILTSVRDVLRYYGHDLSDPMVSEVGSATLFAYVKYRGAYVVAFIGRPQDFLQRWVARTGAELMEKEKCASLRAAWKQVRKLVDGGTPVVLGPLDLRYLPFYPVQFELPWHFNVLIGYGDGTAYIFDNRLPDVQRLSLEDLDKAWRRRSISRGPYAYTVMRPPRELALEKVLVESLRHAVEVNLRPPWRVVGVQAMRRLAAEIGRWPRMLPPQGVKTSVWSLILQSPVRKFHLFPRFLLEAERVLGMPALRGIAEQVLICDDAWAGVSSELKEAEEQGRTEAVLSGVGREIKQIADREEKAYTSLERLLP
ncbi:MAG: BtrH N-terminal domain-containing protein [Chloroflexota bacterium]